MPYLKLSKKALATELFELGGDGYGADLNTKVTVGKSAAGTQFKVRPGVTNTSSGGFADISLAKSGWISRLTSIFDTVNNASNAPAATLYYVSLSKPRLSQRIALSLLPQPIKYVKLMLRRSSVMTGTGSVVIRNASTHAVIAQSDTIDISTIDGTTSTEYTFTFAETVTPNVDILLGFELSDDAAGSYMIYVSTVLSAAVGSAYQYSTSTDGYTAIQNELYMQVLPPTTEYNPYSGGTIASGTWSFQYKLQSLTKYGFTCTATARVSKSPNADGSGATLVGTVTSGNLAVPAVVSGEVTGSISSALPEIVFAEGDYLCIDYILTIVTAGSNAGASCVFEINGGLDTEPVSTCAVNRGLFTPPATSQTYVETGRVQAILATTGKAMTATMNAANEQLIKAAAGSTGTTIRTATGTIQTLLAATGGNASPVKNDEVEQTIKAVAGCTASVTRVATGKAQTILAATGRIATTSMRTATGKTQTIKAAAGSSATATRGATGKVQVAKAVASGTSSVTRGATGRTQVIIATAGKVASTLVQSAAGNAQAIKAAAGGTSSVIRAATGKAQTMRAIAASSAVATFKGAVTQTCKAVTTGSTKAIRADIMTQVAQTVAGASSAVKRVDSGVQTVKAAAASSTHQTMQATALQVAKAVVTEVDAYKGVNIYNENVELTMRSATAGSEVVRRNEAQGQIAKAAATSNSSVTRGATAKLQVIKAVTTHSTVITRNEARGQIAKAAAASSTTATFKALDKLQVTKATVSSTSSVTRGLTGRAQTVKIMGVGATTQAMQEAAKLQVARLTLAETDQKNGAATVYNETGLLNPVKVAAAGTSIQTSTERYKLIPIKAAASRVSSVVSRKETAKLGVVKALSGKLASVTRVDTAKAQTTKALTGVKQQYRAITEAHEQTLAAVIQSVCTTKRLDTGMLQFILAKTAATDVQKYIETGHIADITLITDTEGAHLLYTDGLTCTLKAVIAADDFTGRRFEETGLQVLIKAREQCIQYGDEVNVPCYVYLQAVEYPVYLDIIEHDTVDLSISEAVTQLEVQHPYKVYLSAKELTQ